MLKGVVAEELEFVWICFYALALTWQGGVPRGFRLRALGAADVGYDSTLHEFC